MNRKARRAAKAKLDAGIDALTVADLLDRAKWHRAHGQGEAAEKICDKILTLEPANVQALNILGLIFQESGRHRRAVKTLEKSIAADPCNAPCHFNLANSYCALNRFDEAAAHFKSALIHNDSLNATENLILQNAVIMTCIGRIEANWPMPVKSKELFPPTTLYAIASDLFLRCALETRPICGLTLERFFTSLRLAIIRLVQADAVDPAIEAYVVNLTAAIAQQCFINEYVYAETEWDTQQAARLKAALLQKIMAADEIPLLLLASVAAYFPLHSIPGAHVLLKRSWSGSIDEMLRVHLREPLEEAADRGAIASLTLVDDEVSHQIMRQYEENPYPRWTTSAAVTMNWNRGDWGPGSVAATANQQPEEILIAGCGTGKHAIETALNFPTSRILAIDISVPSLCYARRKSREANICNIEYAHADILNLRPGGREFDRIEAVGVLHHLADPETGWRALLSLLKPNGVMRVGLYSEIARRAIVALREFILERGYQSTKEDIRKCRQEIIREEPPQTVLHMHQFASRTPERMDRPGVRSARFAVFRVA
jgi:ubiquinone/menaquinone biosynthesis C-methylase UbiE/tetratricopeptide (TPR) repeat protein